MKGYVGPEKGRDENVALLLVKGFTFAKQTRSALQGVVADGSRQGTAVPRAAGCSSYGRNDRDQPPGSTIHLAGPPLQASTSL